MDLEGLWALQLFGSAFVPLAAATMTTDRIKQRIAQAFYS